MLSVPRVRPWSPFPLSLAGYLGHSECEFAANRPLVCIC